MELPVDPMDLIQEEKSFNIRYGSFPEENEAAQFPATGVTTNTEYIVDVNRKGCTLSRITFQNRAYVTTVLLRLDIDSKPHQNPDGKKIGGTHLHVYRQGYGETWAYELTDPRLLELCKLFDFTDIAEIQNKQDKIQWFYKFCTICNFTNSIMLKPPSMFD